MAILFKEAERSEQFWYKSFKKYFCEIISESIHRLSSRIRLKVFLYLALMTILFNGENDLRNFHGGSPKEHSCETMSNSIHWFMKRSCLTEQNGLAGEVLLSFFLFITLAAMFLTKWNGLSNFGRSPKKNSCEIVLKLF